MFLKSAIIFAIGYLCCFISFYVKNRRNDLDKINYDKTLIIIISTIFISLVGVFIFNENF